MFSFPNKERSHEWINNLIASASPSPTTSSKLLTGLSGEDVRATTNNFEATGINSIQENSRSSIAPLKTISVVSREIGHAATTSGNSMETASRHDVTQGKPLNKKATTEDVFLVVARERQSIRESDARCRKASQREGHSIVSVNAFDNDNAAAGKNNDQTSPSNCLRAYYRMMYYFGVTAYKPLSKATTALGEGAIWKMGCALQKLLFLYIGIMSAFQSFGNAKYSFLTFITKNGKIRYSALVDLGSDLAFLLAKIYGAYTFALRKEETERMLKAIEKYEETCYSVKKASCRVHVKYSRWMKLLAIITMSLAGLKAVYGSGETDLKDLMKQSSLELSEDLFIWNSENTTKVFNELESQYGKNLTATSILFGLVVIQRNVANNLQLDMVYDLVVIVGVVLCILNKELMMDVNEVTENVPMENMMEFKQLQARREKVWTKFRQMKIAIDAVNEVFDPFLKVLHVGNILMYADFMTFILFKSPSGIAHAFFSLNLVKAELAYFFAAKLADQNDKIRSWIRNWALLSGTIRVGGVDMDANMILDELDKERIGLGRGKFLIHQTFHFKFLGMVLSIFFSMADEEK